MRHKLPKYISQHLLREINQAGNENFALVKLAHLLPKYPSTYLPQMEALIAATFARRKVLDPEFTYTKFSPNWYNIRGYLDNFKQFTARNLTPKYRAMFR